MNSGLLVEQSKVTFEQPSCQLGSALSNGEGHWTWNERGLGIKLGNEKRDCISNLQLGDDVLLMTNSVKHLRRMMMMTDDKKQKRKDLKFTQTKQKWQQIRNQTG